jgi:hypothetical protein
MCLATVCFKSRSLATDISAGLKILTVSRNARIFSCKLKKILFNSENRERERPVFLSDKYET